MPRTVGWLILVQLMGTACCGRAGLYPAAAGTALLSSGNVKVRDCESITVLMCGPVLRYNATSSPNLVGHESQPEAEHELNTFKPLLQYGCSFRLPFFLCAVYVPLCTEKVQAVIGPCRQLCEDVRRHCEPVLNRFGFLWPSSLNCSRFLPQNDRDHMCMEGPTMEKTHTRSTWVITRLPLTRYRGKSTSLSSTASPVYRTDKVATSGSDCSRMHNASAYVYVNRTQRCSLLCHEFGAFSASEKKFAEAWMTIWSVPCFISTLFTVFSFLVDSSRFRYPERAVIAISFCFNVVCIGYITRLLVGREAVACAVVDTSDGPRSVLVEDGSNRIYCTVVFILIYFFSMSSCVWWVLLTLQWFLVVGMLWTREAIERQAGILHVIAWTPPAIQTVAVLIGRSVDANELTGVCDVGGTQSRLLFVTVPLVVFLVAGAAILVAGIVRLGRVRRRVRHRPDRLEALMDRIRVFSMLYVVPATVQLACYLYQYLAASSDVAIQLSSAVLMMQIVCTLIVGSASGVWIWSEKTLHSWKTLFERLCYRHVGGLSSSGGCDSNEEAIVSGKPLGHTDVPPGTPVGHDRALDLSSARYDHQYQYYHHHYHYHHHTLPSNILFHNLRRQ